MFIRGKANTKVSDVLIYCHFDTSIAHVIERPIGVDVSIVPAILMFIRWKPRTKASDLLCDATLT